MTRGYDGQGNLFESAEDPVIYFGRNPTATEAEAGTAVHEEREPWKPLRPGKKGHRTLQALAALNARGPKRWTAYEVSWQLCGDGHGARRELRRLLDRGLVSKDGTKTNVGVVVNGREHVDAYVMTAEGWRELHRLNELTPA